jgi:protoheme IX farnesyltransferase
MVHGDLVSGRADVQNGQAVRDYLSLTKPGIVLWLLITAYCAMVVAGHGAPAWGLAVATMAGLGLSAAGAHAVNMWYDRDIDKLMGRTQDRPVPTGRIPATTALRLGIAAEIVSIPILGLGANWPTALWSMAGFLFYVLVYTFWLKRRTPQNIVIGGAAGAVPPLVGWTAVSPHLAWAPVLMFLIIFLWTPPHFWALALYKQDDYRRAGVPMMPVARGARTAKVQALAYTAALGIASVALYATHVVGVLYLMVAIVLGLGFLAIGVRLLAERDGGDVWARHTFVYSLLYVVALFLAMVVNVKP